MMKEPYIAAIGNACYDEYYSADSWVENGEKLLIRPMEKQAGGMIPNAASVMAAYGVHTYLINYMNDGAGNQELKRDLAAAGLDVTHIITDNRLPDAKCIIVLTPAERTVLVLDFPHPPRVLPPKTQEILRTAAYVYTTMVEMRRFENDLHQADDWRIHGAKLVFDVEASSFESPNDPLFARADVLCFNKGGFEKYVGKRDAEACIQNLLNRGCIVSVTLGADGCQCWDARSHVRLPGWRVNAIDTTGAGDTFNASLVCGLLQGKTLKAAAQFANAAAARATTVLGPRGGAVSMDTVEAFINHCQKGMEQHGCL